MKAGIAAVLRQCAIASLIVSSGVGLFPAQAKDAQPLRDGSHDFDWEIGVWKTHLKVLRHNPDGSAAWATYEGTSDVVPIWNCRANMVELEADDGGGHHIEAINLRLYDPQSHQWSLNFSNVKAGVMGVPTIGEFHDGIGAFYDQEPIDGRAVMVRNVWSNITRDSGHFEQAISDDGGRTWRVNWIADDSRADGTTNKCEKGR